MAVHGITNIGEFKEQPDSPVIEVAPDGILTSARKWKANYAYCLANAPKPGDIEPAPNICNARCATVKISRFATGEATNDKIFGLVECSYIGFFVMPLKQYEWTTLRIDRPIEMHPDFTNASKFPGVPPADLLPGQEPPTKPPPGCKLWDYDKFGMVHFLKFKDVGSATDAKFRGISDYISGGGQWKVVDFLLSKDATSPGLWKIDSPVNPDGWDIPANTGGRMYLKIQHDCMNILKGRSQLYQRTRCWLWNPLGWIGEMYDP